MSKLLYKNFIYHLDINQLTTGSNIVHLTPSEQMLVQYFFEHPNTLITFSQLHTLTQFDEIFLKQKITKLKNIGLTITKVTDGYRLEGTDNHSAPL
jgi:DNA-binding response OmpR family regulator